MPSTRFVSLRRSLEDLRDDLLDLTVTSPTRSDGHKAMSFVLLGSAAVEGFVEQRGIEVATDGVDRFAAALPTRTGRALVTWYLGRTGKEALPLREAECVPHAVWGREALKAYEQIAGSTNGIDGRDLRKLVMPLGLDAVPEQLIDVLDDWAKLRNPTSHTRVPRATRVTTPQAEWDRVQNDVLPLLQTLDADLDRALTNF